MATNDLPGMSGHCGVYEVCPRINSWHSARNTAVSFTGAKICLRTHEAPGQTIEIVWGIVEQLEKSFGEVSGPAVCTI